jgi:copper chaperone CopZ
MILLLFAALRPAAAHAGGTEKVTIKSSVVCNSCKDNITRALAWEKGVKNVEVDLKNKTITVTYNPKKTSPDKIRQAISKAGYDADEVKADPEAYKKLDECCKKDH